MTYNDWEAVKIKKKYPELNLDLTQHSYEGRVYRVDAEATIDTITDSHPDTSLVTSVLVELLSVIVGREKAEGGTLLSYDKPQAPHIKKVKLIAAP